MKPSLRIAYIFLLFVFGTIGVSAQPKLKLWVASFELDQFDMTADNDKYKKVDGNGSLYAIIKVTSSTPGDDLSAYKFNFGNMNSKVELHDGELWVYVQRNAKMVTISRNGYETLNKYDLNTTIVAGKTYTMQLATEAPIIYTQMVQFNVQPVNVGAVVTVLNTKPGAVKESLGVVDQTGSVARSLEYGTYTYEVIAPNYHLSDGRFELKDRNTTHVETVILRPNFSEITLVVDADADIYVNGEKKGHRSWTGTLKSGNYQVECRQENHRNSSQLVVVKDNEDRTVELLRPAPITGTLAITSRPLGATIRIDGKDYGTTPQNINDILIGPHSVTIARANYKPEKQIVEVKEDQTTNLDVTLSDIARMTVSSQPSGSVLYIEGKRVGTTPYTAEMASGDYNIRLTHAKYQDLKRNIHLDSSNPQVTLAMKRQYQQPNSFYIQAGMQAGSLLAAVGTVGCYIRNINLEASYLFGLDKSETVYWNSTGSSDNKPIECTYKPVVYGAKVGYGFIMGTRWRLTPQVGMTVVNASSDQGGYSCYVIDGCIGSKAEVALTSRLGLFVAPEYTLAISKSDGFKQLEPVSSAIKQWGSGFNIRAGVGLTF